MKNSIQKNTTREIATLGITLLILFAVSGVTGRFVNPIAKAAAGSHEKPVNTLRPEADGATRAQITKAFDNLPMRFEANKGQSDEKVEFLSRGSGYTLFLTSTEAVLSLNKADGPHDTSSRTSAGNGLAKSERAHRDVLRMSLPGARRTLRVEGVDELPVRTNYFIGNDPKKWQTDVRQYAKVMYTGVYAGIDLVYYGNQQELEYDFIVAPGASASQIKLAFNGAEKVSIDEKGDLILRTGGGDVRQRKPFIYQEVAGERRAIEGRYAKTGTHEIGFKIGQYDPTKSLVIDPVLTYSTYLGGSNYDFGRSIAVDNAGNAYVTGYTESTNFPTRNQFATDQGFADAFVTKFATNLSGDASLAYSTYLGGTSGDYGFGIAADEAGNVYVTGRTDSTNFPIRNQYQTDQLSADVFVTKLNTNLSGDASLVYSTHVGGSGADIGNAIAVDGSGNVYITGLTQSTNFPVLNQYQTDQFSNDGFVTKLNTNEIGAASLVYSTYLGGNGIDEGAGIAADEMGNAYVTGTIESSDFPTRNALQTDQPNPDGFVTKINTNMSGDASLAYSTYLGGSTTDEGQGIAADEAGNAYVTGYTSAANFPTRNQFQSTTLVGNTNAFVTRLDTNLTADASLVYSTLLVGNSVDIGRAIATDGLGNVYVAGRTDSTNFPLRDHFQTDRPGQDAFVSRINTNLRGDVSLIYSTYFGGSALEEAFGIDIDDAGNAFIIGETYSSDLPVLNQYQTYQTQPVTVRDAFVAKFADPTPDADADGVPDAPDNCLNVFNPNQADFDGDLIGDACDPDDDNDGQTDADEIACGSDPLNAASLAPDNDGDNAPDCVDSDDDNDGVADTADNCQFSANPDQANNDGDSQGDVCDPDDDNDGQTDADEIACGSDPLNAASRAADNDADNSPDCVDPDDDNDGVPDTADNCQFSVNPDQANNDGDSQGDVCDPDDDNDGQSDADEITCGSDPLNAASRSADNDADNSPDCVDPDDDNDGVADTADNCQFSANPDQANNDGDSQGDACDTDDDNDGQTDADEIACGSDPLSAASRAADNDADNSPDCVDLDDDNDGVADTADNCPLTSNPDQADADNDGNGNVCDADDDNDGVADSTDNCPLASNPDQADFDLDGTGDACDPQTGPPTNREQCKNNGWMRFDTPRRFTSQGDCFKFLRSGP